ncbi:MAG: type II secretion system F family protein [Nitrososphaerota archaeon]
MDRELWILSTISSAAIYSILVELLGPGSIEVLAPAFSLFISGAIVYSMNPKAHTGLFKSIQEKVRKAVEEAGLYVNPYEKARIAVYHLKSLIIIGSIYTATVIITHLLFTIPLAFTVLAVTPLIIPPLTGIYVGTFDKVKERRDRVERELPFFSTMAAILSRAGLTIYSALLRASNRVDLFPWISREAKNVRRDVDLGIGVTESLSSRFEKHPSQRLKTMMLTAMSIWRTGGDVSGTLEAYASQYLRELEDRWIQYGRNASGLAEMLTIVFILFPMSVGIMAIAFPLYSTWIISVIAVLLTPMIAVMCYMMIKSMSPAIPDRYSMPPVRFALALTPLALPIISRIPFITIPQIEGLTSMLAGIGCLVSSILIHLIMKSQMEEVSDGERALVGFLRDVIELRRVGYTIVQSFEKCINNPYPERFRELLRRAVARIRMGAGISDSVRDSRSWILRMAFTLLEEVEESGGGSPELLEKVESLIRTHLYSKDRAKSGVRMYTYLILGIPFMISFTSALLIGLATVMAPLSGQSIGGFAISIAKTSDIKSVMDLVMLTSLESAAVMAILVGRAAEQHPFSMWRVVLASMAFIASVALMPQTTDVTLKMLGISGSGGG